jgi:1-pyrroline-5-carboxylate dehydrogenase
MWGDITARAAAELRRPEVEDHFARLIQRTSPKSYAQAAGETRVTRKFLENFSGDQVLARAGTQAQTLMRWEAAARRVD